MPFSTQFSISAELTRLVPLVLAGTAKTYEAAMSLARDLQSSGSDFVVEEDLANIFGRAKVTPKLGSSFRTTIAGANDRAEYIEPLAATISLFTGPGPTVIRALAEEAFFSTVVQSALSRYFERLQQEAPGKWTGRAVPSVEGVTGTLRAIEDQTSDFDWKSILLNVAATIGLEEDSVHKVLPVVVLEGLTTTLPLVQRFPEEHFLFIETEAGVCAVVVWVHVVLGLQVLVKIHSNGRIKETRFGSGPMINVVINVLRSDTQVPEFSEANEMKATLMLQSHSTKEPLFRLAAEPDTDVLDSTAKGTVQGYGTRVLETVVPHRSGRERVIEELRYVACAFAICFSKHLAAAPAGSRAKIETYDDGMGPVDDNIDFEYGQQGESNSVAGSDDLLDCDYIATPMQRLISSMRLIFHDKKIDEKLMKDYTLLYKNQRLPFIENPPRSIGVHIKEWKSDPMWDGADGSSWPRLSLRARQLSIIILACAHVTDLEAAAQMPICERMDRVGETDLWMKQSGWDGVNPVMIGEDAWFQVLTHLLVGHGERFRDEKGSEYTSETCLISNRGWSVFVNTLGDADPSLLGQLTIRKGVPWRNNVWKHRVADGPLRESLGETLTWRVGARAGTEVGMTNRVKVSPGPVLVNERGDSFLVTLRLTARDGAKIHVRRTGYNQLWSSRWFVNNTEPCSHAPSLQDRIRLEPGWSALEGFADHGTLIQMSRMNVIQSAGSSVARWRMLLSVMQQQGLGQREMLRSSDCCFRCAVDQTSRQSGNWYLIL